MAASRWSRSATGRRYSQRTCSDAVAPTWATQGEGFIVASHLGRAVSELPSRVSLDPLGVTAALMGSFSVSGKTPYEGIRRLQAGEYAMIDLQHGTVDGIHSYGTVAELLELGPTAPGEPRELISLLGEAARREGPVEGLFLTSGKDSRAIGMALERRPYGLPIALTYGGWRSRDRRGSVRVARELGLRHRLIGPMRLDIRGFVDEIVAIGGGLSGLQVSQHVAGARAARRRVGSVFSGFLGDILTGKPFSIDHERQCELVLSRHTSWLRHNRETLLPPGASGIIDEVSGVLAARLAERRREVPTLAATVVDLTHRQAHYISGTFDLMHQHVDIATPFFHRPLMSYLLTRRPEDLRDQRLYDAVLSRLEGGRQGEDRPRPLGWLARVVDGRRSPYGTVNWPALTPKTKGWLREVLEPHRDTLPGVLGYDSLSTHATLPFAFFAAPILLARERASG